MDRAPSGCGRLAERAGGRGARARCDRPGDASTMPPCSTSRSRSIELYAGYFGARAHRVGRGFSPAIRGAALRGPAPRPSRVASVLAPLVAGAGARGGRGHPRGQWAPRPPRSSNLRGAAPRGRGGLPTTRSSSIASPRARAKAAAHARSPYASRFANLTAVGELSGALAFSSIPGAVGHRPRPWRWGAFLTLAFAAALSRHGIIRPPLRTLIHALRKAAARRGA